MAKSKRTQARRGTSKGAAKEAATPPAPAASAGAAPGGPGAWTVAEHACAIAAPPDRVWRALTEEMGLWWRAGFYALPNAKGMRLEPVIGGRMVEHADDGSAVVWFTVIGIQPGRTIDLAGHITVSFGGPAVALLHMEVAAAEGGAVVKVAETRIGHCPADCAASAKQGWRMLLDGSLKAYCEK